MACHMEDEKKDTPNISIRRRSLRSRKICPKCLGPIDAKASTLGGWLIPPEYACSRCGYRGMIALETSKVEEYNK